MSDHHAAAAAILEQVQPIGADHPAMEQFAEWATSRAGKRADEFVQAVAARSAPRTAPDDADGAGTAIARPGDVVIVSVPGITAEGAARERARLLANLPGVADVIIVAGAVTVYRPGAITP